MIFNMEEKDFENMSLNEKQAKLKEVMNEINKVNQERLRNGSFEISDITYYKTENGKIFYEVELTNQDENGNEHTSTELYSLDDDENYKKINVEDYDNKINDLNKKIENYQNLDFDTTNMEAQIKGQIEKLENEKKEIEHLSSNQTKTSLRDLNNKENNIKYLAAYYGIPEDQIETYLEINGNNKFAQTEKGNQAQQIEEITKELGIKNSDIKNYTKKDKNGNISLDAKKVNIGGIKSNQISGNEKLTSYYSLNQILGKNYESYMIIKSTNSDSCVLGITKDGNIEKLDNDVITLNNNKEMSLMDESGAIKNVGVMVSFSVKSPGSPNNGKELVGLYNNGGNVGAFYARKELDGVAIGKNIEESRAKNNSSEYNESKILDYKRNNEISGEATSAYKRTYDGCNANINQISSDYEDHADLDSLIANYAEKYEIDKDDLENRVYENLERSHGSNKTDEEIVIESAEELQMEQEKDQQQRPHLPKPHNNNEDKNYEQEESAPEHVLGTPWGNPNLH